MSQTSIAWNDDYNLGIDSIDIQHKHLFEIANRIFSLKESSKVKEEIRVILYELSDYTQKHFEDEEAYMLEIGFPELEDHKQLHKKIVDLVASILDNNHRLDTIQTKMRVIAKRALIEHILHEDMKIQEYQESLEDDSFDLDSLVAM